MPVSCDRCSMRSRNLDDYESYSDAGGLMVLCHACADEVRDEK